MEDTGVSVGWNILYRYVILDVITSLEVRGLVLDAGVEFVVVAAIRTVLSRKFKWKENLHKLTK